MTLSILPISLQLPAGYNFTPSSSGTSSSEPGGSGQADVVSISNAALAGTFTAAAGDTYRMSDLFHASTSDSNGIVGFRVALGDGGETGGGQLWLNGEDVTGRTDFTADEFRNLTYVTGNGVLARIGDRQDDGTLTGEIDSQAVQITASITGSHSINAMNALATPLHGAEADIASIAKQAAILSGWTGADRPTLQTALTPDPPSLASDIETTSGAYRSTSSGQDVDLASIDPSATGSFISAALFASAGGSLAAALLLLDDAATGGFRTAGDLDMQALAIKAYNATSAL